MDIDNFEGVDIEIDELTPCLMDRETGELLLTHYEELTSPLKRDDYRGWNFDWSIPEREGYHIFQLYINDKPEVQGRIALRVQSNSVHVDIVETAPCNYGSNGKYKGVGGHLFAIACKYSFDHGCDGYVDFIAKTAVMEHYRKIIGAKDAGGQRMYIDTLSANRLVEQYLDGKE